MSKTMADDHESTTTSDQKLKAWLEERIVRLELYRYELAQIKEQIDALSHYADYLSEKGQALPRAEKEQREHLEEAWLAKSEEMQHDFEPTASVPFSLEEEMKIYCQTLMEVNERLKHQPEQPKTSLHDLYTTETGQPEQRDQDRGLSR
jgi:hypothetical protein